MTTHDISTDPSETTPRLAEPRRLVWWTMLIVLALVSGSGVVALVWPVVVDSTVGSPRSESTIAPDGPGLPGTAVPILDSPHIPVGLAGTVHYTSVPATSGPHFAVPPAMGSYDDPMPEGLQVHALEHGHIGVQYASDVSASDVETLRRIGARYPDDVFVAPDPAIGHGIALTAWGRIDTFDALDEARIARFIDALKGRYDHGWTGRRG